MLVMTTCLSSTCVGCLYRGLGKAGHKRGSVEIIAEDHPWAEDGKLIWDALHTYIADYVVSSPALLLCRWCTGNQGHDAT